MHVQSHHELAWICCAPVHTRACLTRASQRCALCGHTRIPVERRCDGLIDFVSQILSSTDSWSCMALQCGFHLPVRTHHHAALVTVVKSAKAMGTAQSMYTVCMQVCMQDAVDVRPMHISGCVAAMCVSPHAHTLVRQGHEGGGSRLKLHCVNAPRLRDVLLEQCLASRQQAVPTDAHHCKVLCFLPARAHRFVDPGRHRCDLLIPV